MTTSASAMLPVAGQHFKRLLLMVAVAAIPAGVIACGSIAVAGDEEEASHTPIYRYKDEHGSVVFTNDLSRVPAESRSSATAVDLPPLHKAKEFSPSVEQETTSLLSQAQDWFRNLSPTRWLIGVILGALIVTLWGLNFVSKRTERPIVRLAFRLGMLTIVLVSAYLCYMIVVSAQTVSLFGVKTEGRDPLAEINRAIESTHVDETNRLNAIVGLPNQE